MTPQTAFPLPLKIRALPVWELAVLESGRQIYQILASFVFISIDHGRITVPKGQTTDFGSVPSLTKSLIDNDDIHLLFPSVIHDYLYVCQGLCGGRNMTREQCDEVLRDGMRIMGSPKWKSEAVFRAVRLGGQPYWDS